MGRLGSMWSPRKWENTQSDPRREQTVKEVIKLGALLVFEFVFVFVFVIKSIFVFVFVAQVQHGQWSRKWSKLRQRQARSDKRVPMYSRSGQHHLSFDIRKVRKWLFKHSSKSKSMLNIGLCTYPYHVCKVKAKIYQFQFSPKPGCSVHLSKPCQVAPSHLPPSPSLLDGFCPRCGHQRSF